jgi:hypothetical protein
VTAEALALLGASRRRRRRSSRLPRGCSRAAHHDECAGGRPRRCARAAAAPDDLAAQSGSAVRSRPKRRYGPCCSASSGTTDLRRRSRAQGRIDLFGLLGSDHPGAPVPPALARCCCGRTCPQISSAHGAGCILPTYRVRGRAGGAAGGRSRRARLGRGRPLPALLRAHGAEAVSRRSPTAAGPSELRDLGGGALLRVGRRPRSGAAPAQRLAAAGHTALGPCASPTGISSTTGSAPRSTPFARRAGDDDWSASRTPSYRRAADVALRTLSLDLETTPDASQIFSAALAGCGVEGALVARARSPAHLPQAGAAPGTGRAHPRPRPDLLLG